ncbi:MAG: LysM peptidoglycan-binding domain-containing protein [Ruminococcaceae bacterium]|nr:LysM peptidoglycan-binding domain-containing protein [Oscillospiraceae bacterium]
MIIYTAILGDTLYSIARRFGLTVGELERFNGFDDPDNLSVGQDVLIPVDESNHVVSRGESLYSIAIEYGTTVEEIIAANPNLRPPYMIYPGMELLIPRSSAQKRTVEINGYAYPSISDRTLSDTLPFLSYLSIFSHSVNSDGTLNSLDDSRLIEAAKEMDVKPIMVITNTVEGGGFKSEITNSVLNSPDIRQTLINNIVSTARSKGYGGVDVDFEYIYPDDREKYNEFLELLNTALDRYNLTLSTAIAPKISADQQGTLYEAHDYQFHGKTVDRVIIMTYEWGYLYGPPMAVAPINEVRRVLSYAVTEIPPQKILMGVPNYGYDWTLPFMQGRPARILSINNAISLAAEVGAEIQFNNTSQAPFFEYTRDGNKHIVWFENPRSLKAKASLMSDFNLKGLSVWTVNQFYLQMWRVFDDMFNIRKFPGQET